jgi:hypothetical protein
MNNLRTFEEFKWPFNFGKKKTNIIDNNDPYSEEVDDHDNEKSWYYEDLPSNDYNKIHCPSCGSSDTYEERYDWHVCNNCNSWF